MPSKTARSLEASLFSFPAINQYFRPRTEPQPSPNDPFSNPLSKTALSSAQCLFPVLLLTGANCGLGLAILTLLSTSPQTSYCIFLLACRTPSSGYEAIASLKGPLHSLLPARTDEMHAITIDLSSDDSIRNAVKEVQTKWGRLNVLVNNAGVAAIPQIDPMSEDSDYRATFHGVLDVNVTAVAYLTTLCLPMLRVSAKEEECGGRVINISSARASLSRAAAELLPPSVSLAYDISKTALNRLTVGMAMDKENRDAGVKFSLVNPGHCKTAFNGYRGTRDPLEGVSAVVEILGRGKGWQGAKPKREVGGDGEGDENVDLGEVAVRETIGAGTELKRMDW